MGGHVVNKQPCTMSGGRCFEKSSSKKSLRVIGRVRVKNAGERVGAFKVEGATSVWHVGNKYFWNTYHTPFLNARIEREVDCCSYEEYFHDILSFISLSLKGM